MQNSVVSQHEPNTIVDLYEPAANTSSGDGTGAYREIVCGDSVSHCECVATATKI